VSNGPKLIVLINFVPTQVAPLGQICLAQECVSATRTTMGMESPAMHVPQGRLPKVGPRLHLTVISHLGMP
jgi:hypothetical protein